MAYYAVPGNVSVMKIDSEEILRLALMSACACAA
jgi:hypothetical protein